MMIMQPTWITDAIASEAAAAATAKRQPPLCRRAGSMYAEGWSLQLLHIGSFDDEAPKLKYLHTEYQAGT